MKGNQAIGLILLVTLTSILGFSSNKSWIEQGSRSSLEKDVGAWHISAGSWSWVDGTAGNVMEYRIVGETGSTRLYLKDHQTIYGRVAVCQLKQKIDVQAPQAYIKIKYKTLYKVGSCNIYVDVRFAQGDQWFFWHHNLQQTYGELTIPIKQESNNGGNNRGETPPMHWTMKEIAFGIEGCGDPVPNVCEAETICYSLTLHIEDD